MKINFARIFYFFLICWFIVLITVHYFNQRPLWNDELCIFDNIKFLTSFDIFNQPLMHGQQFPRFYLFLIQQVSQIYDHSLLILRLLPFIFMMGAFICWLAIIHLIWKDYLPKILFVAMWLASIPLIYYAAELKQYSADVCAVAVVAWVMLKKYYQGKHIAILGYLPLLGFFSYPVFMIMPLILYNESKQVSFDVRKWPRWVWFFLWVLVLTIIGVYYLDLKNSNAGLLINYWQDYMISLNSFELFFKTLGEGFNNLISRWFAEYPKWIKIFSRIILGAGLIYFCLRFWKIFKNHGYQFRCLISIAGGVLLGHFLLGVLQKYPFVVPRTSLFFAPFLFFLSIYFLIQMRLKYKKTIDIMMLILGSILLVINYGIAYQLIVNGDLGAQSVLFD